MFHFLGLGKQRVIALFISFVLILTMVPLNTFVYADEKEGGESSTTTWSFRGGQEGAYNSIVDKSIGEFAGIIINAETGKCVARDSGDTLVDVGTKLCVPVSGSAIIRVETNVGYHDYTINGVTPNSDSYEYTYIGEAGYVVIESLSSVYLYEISRTPYSVDDNDTTETPTTTMSLIADNVAAGTYTTSYETNGFTITASSEKSVVVDSSSKTADDGTSFTQRIKLGGTGSADNRSIRFHTSAAATVKVYAMSSSSSADRAITLYKLDGTVVGSVPAYGSSLSLGSIEIKEGGDYYLVSPSSGVNVYGVIVTFEGTVTEPERADWNSVAAPFISRAVQNGTKMVVNFELVTGVDGADKATIHMFDATGTVVDSILVGTDPSSTTRTVEFTPQASGNYTFKVVAERTDEITVKESTVSETSSFVLPLTAPFIKSATSKGNGSIEITWDEVKEAERYIVSYKVDGRDDTTATTVTETSVVVSGLTTGLKYLFAVKAVRGNDESALTETVATVTEDAQRVWYFSAFGQGTDTTNNYYNGNANDGSVTVASENGKGKLVPASTDGISFYYTTIDADKENFILTATVAVDSWTYSNGQEGFGLMAADAVGINGDSSVFWNNSYMNSITKVEYFWDSVNHIVSDAGDRITMKLGIGAQEKRGATAANIADGTILTNINELFKSTMATLDTSCASKGVGTYNLVGNYQNSVAPTGTLDEASLLKTFQLSIQRDNTGYRISYTDEAGNKSTKLYYDIERDALTQIDKDSMYIGFFASRNAKITVTDIELTTSDPTKDAPPEGRDITYVTPVYNILSTTEIGVPNYELIFHANADGLLTMKDSNDNAITTRELVSANTYIKKSVLLTNGLNHFTVEFTPNSDYKLSEYEYLSSYETVKFEHNVIYKSYNRNGLYVSPSGTSNGTGSKSSPLDIYTAVKYVKPGQKIVLAGGTYQLTSTVVVKRGINGTEDNMIYLVADPSSSERPIFIFNKACAGMIFAGDYWYMKGFDVTQSADVQKGLQLSGSHCILDNVNTYFNGNTGIQISRYLTTDLYEDWPAYNLVQNCTSYGNADRGYEDADGFAAKLTIGDGNIFDGCIAYNNADDGWDLFAKPETGAIGKVVIQNCVAYGNGYLPDGTNAGNGNGFKLGGSSITGYHKLINCISYNNKAKGIDSNSCPDIQVYNCTTFNNDSYNIAFYTNDVANTDYYADGIISFRTTNTTVSENIKVKGSQDATKIYKTSNYYWDATSQTSKNTENKEVSVDWFVSIDTTIHLTRNNDGTINMNGLLTLTDEAPSDAGARMDSMASKDIIIPEDANETPLPTPTLLPSPTTTPTHLQADENETDLTILLPKVTVNGMTTEQMAEKILFVGGTIDKTEELITVLPESIQDLLDKGLIECKVTYVTSDKAVATVSKNGKITAKGVGTTIITTNIVISDNILKFKTKITVNKAYIKFIKASKKIEINENVDFKLAVYGFDEKDIVWMTSKKKISIVGKNYGKTTAVVTGKSTGTDTVYVKVRVGDDSYLYVKNVIIVIDLKESDPKELDTKNLIYVVKKGDNLWKIAKLNHCKVSDLLDLNDIENVDKIYIGQKLIIPR